MIILNFVTLLIKSNIDQNRLQVTSKSRSMLVRTGFLSAGTPLTLLLVHGRARRVAAASSCGAHRASTPTRRVASPNT